MFCYSRFLPLARSFWYPYTQKKKKKKKRGSENNVTMHALSLSLSQISESPKDRLTTYQRPPVRPFFVMIIGDSTSYTRLCNLRESRVPGLQKHLCAAAFMTLSELSSLFNPSEIKFGFVLLNHRRRFLCARDSHHRYHMLGGEK